MTSTTLRITKPQVKVIRLTKTNPTTLRIGLAKGEKGEPGHSFTNYPAGEALGGHRMVALLDGKFWYADKDNPDHIAAVVGMTTGAVSEGEIPTVLTDGEITEPTWALTPNRAFYLGNNGLVSNTAPSTGFVLDCGLTTATGAIFIHLGKAWAKG
jgi:hypothetical protein